MKPQTDFMLDSQSHEFPESEAQGHFAFIGESGSGKTALLSHLWETAFQDLGHGSVVWDPAQDMLIRSSSVNDQAIVKTLNPHDDRGTAWNLGADVTESRIATDAAFTLIPEAGESQPFFQNAARHMLEGLMATFEGRLP